MRAAGLDVISTNRGYILNEPVAASRVLKVCHTDEQLEEEIHALAGEPFNIASPKQVGEVLFEKLKISDKAKKTKKGQYVTSEDVLETLRSKHPIVEKILEHRGLKN